MRFLLVIRGWRERRLRRVRGEGEGEEVEEPDEYDVDGVLGDAVWGPDESDDDDDLRKMHMFRV
jgi:hypothetical protein